MALAALASPSPVKRGRGVKRSRGTIQAIGHPTVHLVDPEDVGLLRFEETGESPEGMDFAVLWNGAWREGCGYPSFPEGTFVPICSKVNSQWVRRPCHRERIF